MPKRLILLVAHPNDPDQPYPNDWAGPEEIRSMTTNSKILRQCTANLDDRNPWIYFQRMGFQKDASQIIGRARIHRIDENSMKVYFEDWEPYDAPGVRAYGGSALGDFTE